MPSTSSPAVDTSKARRDRIARLDRLADTLDTRFRVFGIPVGWDSIIGLVPGLGDLVTAGPGIIMFYEANRIGARKRAMAKIAANTGVDMLIGGIPVLGDAFDVFFKSHRRNVEILKRELTRVEEAEGQRALRRTDRIETTAHRKDQQVNRRT